MEPTQTEMPPHSMEAEQGAVGCLLIDPELVHELASNHVTPDWFYHLPHRIIVEFVVAMVNERQPVDLITLGNRLKSADSYEGIGGAPYLMSLMDCVPSAANFPYYLDILREKTAQRRMAATCAAIVSGLRENIPPDLDRIEAALADARSVGVKPNGGIVASKTACLKFAEWLQNRIQNAGKLSGVPTGIRVLDRMLDGIQYAEFTLFAARPSVGKTALGCCVVASAVNEGIPTLFVTAEMSDKMIVRRMVANHASVSMTSLKEGVVSEAENQRICTAIHKISRAPLYFEEQMGGATIGKLIAAIRSAIRKHGVKFVVIDYVQKFKGDTRREKRTEELGEVCTKLQGIARETGIAVLALAQLNRENEKEKKPRAPKLTDLGDSKELEQDADAVVMIHRDRSETSGEAQLIVTKQRDGECGPVRVHYEGKYCRFSNLETKIDHDAK